MKQVRKPEKKGLHNYSEIMTVEMVILKRTFSLEFGKNEIKVNHKFLK